MDINVTSDVLIMKHTPIAQRMETKKSEKFVILINNLMYLVRSTVGKSAANFSKMELPSRLIALVMVSQKWLLSVDFPEVIFDEVKSSGILQYPCRICWQNHNHSKRLVVRNCSM